MATLPAEEQLVAERLASGGLPAVRKAIAEEQERAKAEGRPPVAGDSIVELAERLQPDVKAAVWMDRAEAAVAHLDELGLRDLRATVVTATARDEAGRDLERRLREGLERRVSKLRTDWEEHLTQALSDGRVLQALRLSARPPEPTARFPAGLIERLTSQVGAGMSAETSPERWLALLDAAVACPVRRQIKPAGIPEDPTGEVQRKAREAAGRIPSLAPMLGMAMPPPPKPVPGERVARTRPIRPARPPRPSRPGRPESSPSRAERGAGDTSATPRASADAPTELSDVVESAGSEPWAATVAAPEPVAAPDPGTSDEPVAADEPGPSAPVDPPEPVVPVDPPEPVVPADVPEPVVPVDPPEPVVPADVPEPVVPVDPPEPVVPADVPEPVADVPTATGVAADQVPPADADRPDGRAGGSDATAIVDPGIAPVDQL
jgi:hypothetical protein